MDISNSSLQLQDSGVFLFDCQSFLDQSNLTSDVGYYSASSSLSPTSSIDSCGFSPPAYTCGVGADIPQILQHNSTQAKRKTGRPRSKFPGVKRETASEREKLRMRDLTKALHHLRTYLPPSVAPAGKTLTKIETLRLAIQYISDLSEQLVIGEDEVRLGVASEQIQIGDTSLSTFNQFCEEPTVIQRSPAQQFQPCYQNADDFLAFQTQEFWRRQQQQFFNGRC
nr:mesoderm posterior aa [Misgurnus anguillicaudatus]